MTLHFQIWGIVEIIPTSQTAIHVLFRYKLHKGTMKTITVQRHFSFLYEMHTTWKQLSNSVGSGPVFEFEKFA